MPEHACTHRHMWTSGFWEDCVGAAHGDCCVPGWVCAGGGLPCSLHIVRLERSPSGHSGLGFRVGGMQVDRR